MKTLYFEALAVIFCTTMLRAEESELPLRTETEKRCTLN